MERPHQGQSEIGVSGVLCRLFFILCVGLWLVFGFFVLEAFGMTLAGDADGLGMGLFCILILIVSVPALVIAIVLSTLAQRLSMRFRILSLLPASTAILIAVTMMVILYVQGK